MHVAYIHQHFVSPRGSAGTRSYEMAQRLMRAGHRVTLICGANDGNALDNDLTQPVSKLDVNGLTVFCINTFYSNRMGFIQRVSTFHRFAKGAMRIVRELDANLVFASSTPLTVGIPGMRAARHLSVPFVFEVRDLWPEIPIAIGAVKSPVLKWYLRRLEKKIYFAAKHIIALSPGMKEGICRTGYPQERVTMIPNSADLGLFQPTRERLDDDRFGPPDDVRFIFTGAHGPANGLDALLDAAAELKRRKARGVRIVLIGDGKSKPHLLERSQREGLEDFVTFIPRIPKTELATLLPRMDVGLMILKNLPSFYYGTSPNKFFDYLASGIPVLNNYPGWVADMIKEHDCGRGIPPDDPRAFADAMLWFRQHRNELPEMGRRGRALAEARFSRDELGAKLIETLEHVHAEYHA